MRNNILRNTLLGLFVFSAFVASSQNVGINISGSTPGASTILDLNTGVGGHLGFLAEQVSLVSNTDVATIAAPATGLIVYNSNAGMTNGGLGYYYWNGAAWVAMAGNAGNWLITGNSNTVVGTDYLGTNDANALEFKANGQKSGWIDYATPFGSFFGYQSGNVNSTTDNTGFGYRTLKINTGTDNTAVGFEALLSNVGGIDNTAVGSGAMIAGASPANSTALGYDALYFNTGSNNTAVGYQALESITSGINNTAMGLQASYVSAGGANQISAFGTYALKNNLAGANTALGFEAGLTNAAGTTNTFLGVVADESNGTFNNVTSVGANAYAGASNTLVLGSVFGLNSGSADVKVGIGTNVPSQKLQVNNGNILISNSAIGSDGATVGQMQLQGTGAGVSTFQAGAQGATNYNYTLPTAAPAVTQILDVTAYAAPAVSLGYLSQPTGNIVGIKIITANTAATAFDAGTTFILYRVIGGGGAGGGCKFTTTGPCIASTAGTGDMAGSGGGAGQYTEGIVTGLQGAGSTYAVTIGAGGVGQAACGQPIAGDGGNTVLTVTNPVIVTITSEGGFVGQSLEEEQSANNFFKLAGGNGGYIVNPGALNIQGANGGYASITQNGTDAAESGPGGSSVFGGGASGYEERDVSGQPGNAATNYGSGGGGGTYAGVTAVNATCTGGNGFQGIVIIYEYQ